MQVYAVGRPEGPPRTAKDPQLLLWIEDHQCLMVTNDRASLATHLRDHLAAGHHMPGILVVPRFFSFRTLIDQLHLIWGASLPDEYRDQIVYLPLRS